MITSVPPQRPRRVPDTHVVRQKDGAVLLRDDHSGAEVALNPTAHALWELCDGATHVDEMVSAICDLFAIERQQAGADVRRALADMQSAGVIV